MMNIKLKLHDLTSNILDGLNNYFQIIKKPFKSYKNTFITLISIYSLLMSFLMLL